MKVLNAMILLTVTLLIINTIGYAAAIPECGVCVCEDDEEVVEESEEVSEGVMALTIILIIIFVVLLSVLVIYLTKKEPVNGPIDTNYY